MCVQASNNSSISDLLGGRRRRRFVRIMKPLLPRKRSSSARIDLNKHWNELEELYAAGGSSRVTHFDRLVLHNEMNDNALNEAREAEAGASDAAAATSPVFLEHVETDLLLTPPPTPPLCETSSFSFNDIAAMIALPLEEDPAAADEESEPMMSPARTPEPWDVFIFPSRAPVDGNTRRSSSSSSLM